MSQSEPSELIFDKAIELAQCSGWYKNILQDACIECNLDPFEHEIWFPSGRKEILDLLEQKYDTQALEIFRDSIEHGQEYKGITHKISTLLKNRVLEVEKSRVLTLQNSYFYLKPQNTKFALKLAWRTVDGIWYAVNDVSTDFNYYTKRSLLLGVYLSSQTYHLKNNDPQKTQEFIDRSLNQIVSTAQTTTKCFKLIPQKISNLPFIRMFV